MKVGDRVCRRGEPIDLIGDVDAVKEVSPGRVRVAVTWDKTSTSGRRYGRECGTVIYHEAELVSLSGA